MTTATPAARQEPIRQRTLLTLAEVCDELGVSSQTFYHWRHIGTAPRCIKLPSGDLRVRRDTLAAWRAAPAGAPAVSGVTFDVSVYTLVVRPGKTSTGYTVQWRVARQRWQQTFRVRAQAVSFHSSLCSALSGGEGFDPATGRPVSWPRPLAEVSWYDFCIAFVDSKWAAASANRRASIACALTIATMPMIRSARRAQHESRQIRVALRQYGFNTKRRASCPPDIAVTLAWLSRNTRPVSVLADRAVLRAVLDATSTRPDGQPYKASTVRSYQGVLVNAINYAVETGALRDNPLASLSWKRPTASALVDRRSVVNHDQARRLLKAVGDVPRPSAPRLVAFFALLYYSGLRPEEAVALRRDDVVLPDLVRNPDTGEWEEPADGWGELTLRAAAAEAGGMWTDHGAPHEQRHLKSRRPGDYRRVPAPPPLVALLRAHLRDYPAGPDGRVFTGILGRLLSSKVYRPVWLEARQLALTPEEYSSPLARRIYDLRHAAVSTWLSGGVPAVQVAEWAGHSVQVLLRIYARCIDGGDADARRRIGLALGLNDRGGADDRGQRPAG